MDNEKWDEERKEQVRAIFNAGAQSGIRAILALIRAEEDVYGKDTEKGKALAKLAEGVEEIAGIWSMKKREEGAENAD